MGAEVQLLTLLGVGRRKGMRGAGHAEMELCCARAQPAPRTAWKLGQKCRKDDELGCSFTQAEKFQGSCYFSYCCLLAPRRPPK